MQFRSAKGDLFWWAVSWILKKKNFFSNAWKNGLWVGGLYTFYIVSTVHKAFQSILCIKHFSLFCFIKVNIQSLIILNSCSKPNYFPWLTHQMLTKYNISYIKISYPVSCAVVVWWLVLKRIFTNPFNIKLVRGWLATRHQKNKSSEWAVLPNGTSLIILSPHFCYWNFNELRI